MGKAMGAFSSPLDAEALWLVQEEVLAKLLAGGNTAALYDAIWSTTSSAGSRRSRRPQWSGAASSTPFV